MSLNCGLTLSLDLSSGLGSLQIPSVKQIYILFLYINSFAEIANNMRVVGKAAVKKFINKAFLEACPRAIQTVIANFYDGNSGSGIRASIDPEDGTGDRKGG